MIESIEGNGKLKEEIILQEVLIKNLRSETEMLRNKLADIPKPKTVILVEKDTQYYPDSPLRSQRKTTSRGYQNDDNYSR